MSQIRIAPSHSAPFTRFLVEGRQAAAVSAPALFFLCLSCFSFGLASSAAADASLENLIGAETVAAESFVMETELRIANDMPVLLAQAGSGGDAGRSRPLEPRYQPREPEPNSGYNGSYLFALTRSVADSTIAPAGQVPLYVLTVPLDIALLPFALIGGLFG